VLARSFGTVDADGYKNALPLAPFDNPEQVIQAERLRAVEYGLAMAVWWIAIDEIARLRPIHCFFVFHTQESRALGPSMPLVNPPTEGLWPYRVVDATRR
jgi:hypothetical protein